MKHSDKHAPSKKDAPSKSGIQIHGVNGNGEHCMIVSCNEGRFAAHGEHLVLCKGSIDPGESPLHAALRETREECGVDLVTYLGKKNIEKLERGVTVENITNLSFPGTEILSFKAKPNRHMYHARTGNTHGMWMYDVRVKGIENFVPFLKNSTGKLTSELIKDDPARPRFPTFLHWLEQGSIPEESKHNDLQIKLPAIPLWKPEWFASRVKKYAPNGVIDSREAWQKFCENMPNGDNEYKRLRAAFSTIKQRLLDHGWITGDSGILKFDEKDCAMHFYSERGRYGTSVAIFSKVLRDMLENPDYARAFGGQDTKLKNLTAEQKMLLGQVAGFIPFIPEKDLRAALREAYGPAHRVNSHANEIIRTGGRHLHDSYREAVRSRPRQPSVADRNR